MLSTLAGLEEGDHHETSTCLCHLKTSGLAFAAEDNLRLMEESEACLGPASRS